MNKKIIAITATVVALIIVVIVAGFLLIRNPEKQEVKQMADDLAPFVTDMTKEEIKDVLETPLSEEQVHAFEDVLEANYVAPIDETKDIEVTDDNIIIYTDTEGNEVEYQLDSDLLEMTDEEVDAEMAAIFAELGYEGIDLYGDVSQIENQLNTKNNNINESNEAEDDDLGWGEDTSIPDEDEGEYSDSTEYGIIKLVPGRDGTIAGDGIYEGTISDTAP